MFREQGFACGSFLFANLALHSQGKSRLGMNRWRTALGEGLGLRGWGTWSTEDCSDFRVLGQWELHKAGWSWWGSAPHDPSVSPMSPPAHAMQRPALIPPPGMVQEQSVPGGPHGGCKAAIPLPDLTGVPSTPFPGDSQGRDWGISSSVGEAHGQQAQGRREELAEMLVLQSF